MDFLKKELERKRKAAQEDFGGRKFVRRAELEQKSIEKLRKEEEEERREKAMKEKAGPKGVEAGKQEAAAAKQEATTKSKADDKLAQIEAELDALEPAEVRRRLRLLKQPVTVFGEDDAARVARFKELLRAGVLLDDSDDEELMKGQRNDFLKDIAQMRRKEKSGVGVDKKKAGKEGAKDGVASGAEASGGENMSEGDGGKDAKLMKADWEQLSDEERILVYFKRLLREWGQELDDMPEKELRTSKGRSLIATQNQCQRYLEPMFRLCRKKRLPDDIRGSLMKIINFCRERDYRLASDAYVKLAIGNAPWPIGATSIGIHDRSAREKISATKIAHVMNDETTRKYLQSVKRLMTFAQRKYPTDPSKSLEFNSLANGSDLVALKIDRVHQTQQQQQAGMLRLEAGPQPVDGERP